MGKIIGKSALCFAGLCVVSGLLMFLDDVMINWGNITSKSFVLFKTLVLSDLMWFIVAIAYAYLLFRIFKNEPNRFFIIAMNGLIILILFFILSYLKVDSTISYFMLKMMQADSISVVMLALMFKPIFSIRKELKKSYRKCISILLVVIKSFAGLFIIIALAVILQVVLHVKGNLLIPFQHTRFVFLIGTIIYSGFMYKFLYQNKQAIMIICANAAVLMLISFIATTSNTYYLLGCPVLSWLTLSGLTGSAALLVPLLFIVYRSIHKQRFSPVTNHNNE